MSFPIERIRSCFPSLSLQQRVYFDNPAGTQVPVQMLDQLRDYLLRSVGNSGGAFITSIDTDAMTAMAREAMAQFFNAASTQEVIFGPAMTALTLHISFALERNFAPGDEIIVTRMDHDGNVSPWRLLAERRGLVLKTLDFNEETFRYDFAALDRLLTPRTKLIAVNYASNLTGTISDVAEVARRAKSVGALVYVDAVQFAPHGIIDVQALGCDFLVCSAYKFFGPHLAILWGRKALLETLTPPKLRVATNDLPFRFELGTPPFEQIAALLGTLNYYAWVGDIVGNGERASSGEPLGVRINRGKVAMQHYEETLSLALIRGLQQIRGVRIYGITAESEIHERVSTVSFTLAGKSPAYVAGELAKRDIFVWNGDNFAIDMVEKFGLANSGGIVRAGPVHYNTHAEITRFIDAMNVIARA